MYPAGGVGGQGNLQGGGGREDGADKKRKIREEGGSEENTGSGGGKRIFRGASMQTSPEAVLQVCCNICI